MTQLDELIEVVYSAEMDKADKETKRALDSIATSFQTIADAARPSVAEPADLSELKSDVRDITTHLGWHRNVGWGIAAVFSGAFAWLLASYVPQQVNHAQEHSKAETAEMLRPINESLVRLTTLVELSRPNAAATLPQAMKNNLRGSNQYGAEIGFKTVGSMADKARELGVVANRKQIGEVGLDLLSNRLSQKTGLSDIAWGATTDLLNYNSFLLSSLKPSLTKGAVHLSPSDTIGVDLDFGFAEKQTDNLVISWLGLTSPDNAALALEIGKEAPHDQSFYPANVIIQSGHGTRIDIDQRRFKNVTFIGINIVYRGGPLVLENVFFLDCTFTFPDDEKTRSLGKELFASERVSFDSKKS